ncbi:MAG: radical SAM protein, partial [Gammaproteobacteria bacterium]|nr:radical SAM protein [Gammaproteobacteria bacterium]
MSEQNKAVNRFGKEVVTDIPEDAPMAEKPGHKLRTSNRIVDRQKLGESTGVESAKLDSLQGQKIEFVEY